jgi:hypothetical protein
MAMAGAAGGMQVPRMAGWSAPFGGMARGLAQMMPLMVQMQADRQAQQRQDAANAALAQAGQQIHDKARAIALGHSALTCTPYGSASGTLATGPDRSSAAVICPNAGLATCRAYAR